MKKNILVTGGAGYIGSHVTNLLIDKGFSIEQIALISGIYIFISLIAYNLISLFILFVLDPVTTSNIAPVPNLG